MRTCIKSIRHLSHLRLAGPIIWTAIVLQWAANIIPATIRRATDVQPTTLQRAANVQSAAILQRTANVQSAALQRAADVQRTANVQRAAATRFRSTNTSTEKKEKMAALCRHWRMCCCSGNRNCTDRNQTSNQGSDKRRFPYNNGTVYHVSYNGSFRDRASTTGGSRHKNRYDLYGWFRSGKPVSGSFHGY